MALEEKDIEQIKGILSDTLKESGVTDAAGTITAPKRPTREEILAVKSPRERQKLISENLDLFQDSLH